jgi:Tfp pilus assembly protein FimT
MKILFAYEGKERTRQTIMRSLEAKPGLRGPRARGFSLIEMMIVVALTIVVSVISVVSFTPLVNSQRLTNAYNTTLAAMRQARDNAVSQRTSYSVTFTNSVTPNTITVAWAPPSGVNSWPNGAVPAAVTYQYPTTVLFAIPPTNSTPAPDNYGSGGNAIDFGYTSNGNTGGTTQNVVYFCPDGSAQITNTCSGAGNWDGGVVYLMRTGDVGSYRAVSLWGGTGRIHGWRLYANTGGYQWIRQ